MRPAAAALMKPQNTIASELQSLGFDQVTAIDQKITGGKSLGYYENALVTHAAVFHNKLSGRVGNYLESNDVQVAIHGKEISGTCSCHRSGKICQHVVSLLYAWANDAAEFKNIALVLAEIKKFDKARLLEIVTKILQQNPAFADIFLMTSKPDWDEIDLTI
jgi:hypothetical protein